MGNVCGWGLLFERFSSSVFVFKTFYPDQPFWLLYAFLIAWMGDSSAYFGGRYWGEQVMFTG